MRDIWYLVLPLIISALITPVVKQIGYRLDAFAQMNERTVHHGKIVRIGGVAIYLAFIITMALYVKTDMAMNGILIGSTIMFIGGLVDDLVNLKPLYKFSFQVVAAIVLIASGVTLDVIRLPLGITINMGVVSFIVTFFWITGITNAVNLIDGLDGLCGGISVIILTVIAMLAVIEGRGDVEMIALILVGATLGFLIYNAHLMLGLAGAGRGLENAERTAEFINRTGPKRIINFTIFHHESAPLYRDVEAGIFVPSGELENLLEERKLLQLLQVPIESYDGFHDHIEVRTRGRLPEDRSRMLAHLEDAIAREERKAS